MASLKKGKDRKTIGGERYKHQLKERDKDIIGKYSPKNKKDRMLSTRHKSQLKIKTNFFRSKKETKNHGERKKDRGKDRKKQKLTFKSQ